jgi:carbonic anhydrase
MATKFSLLMTMVGFLLACSFGLASETGPGTNADEALKKLLDGNSNYVSNRLTMKDSSGPKTRQALAAGQRPYAVILSCSDSRVPPEIIFDKGLGEIFVVRVAGNIADPIIIGSIEYAVEHFGSSLIMVLGHSRCGAVTAAVDATGHEHGNIGAIVNTISPAVQLARKETKWADKSQLVEASVDMNVKLTAKSLVEQSPVIRSLVDSGKLKIVSAKYDLDDGTVKLLEK